MSATSAISVPLEAGTRALVLGLGRTGLSVSRYLQRKGLDVRVADTRAVPPGSAALRQQAPAAELRTGAFASSLLDGVAQVVISPGLSLREPLVREALDRGLPVVGDIELFAREAPAPVVAVTGTNGKSTVTTLVAELALAGGRRALAGGNLGEPALDLLERPVPDVYVLELSSFQLETTHSLRTAAATVLNVTPDHMDRYATLAEYAAAKARIFDGCEVAVINADDAAVRAMPRAGQRVVSFSLEARERGLRPAATARTDDRAPRRAAAAAGGDEAAGPAQCRQRNGRARAGRGAGAADRSGTRGAVRLRRPAAPVAMGRRRRRRPLRQ
jgi:UDP-N-acetylmuramoylalanine--D-glutamate ligase